MKKILLLVVLATSSTFALAQVCDVTYSVDTETADGQNVMTSSTTLYAVPMADVLDNSARGLRVVNIMSQSDGKGGPYSIETGEVRSCDGKPPERVAANSVMVKGVTLKDSNRINREALRQADGIVKRYEKRAERGDKHGWDHAKAKKVKRNDLGQKLPQ